ncbi:hypothetical protein THAOC_24916, partial [Thalassiosira oceanica]
MARDFHTLGGWGVLVALLREGPDSRPGAGPEGEDELAVLADEVRALAAMAVGTAAGNVGEFRRWALEDVSPAVAGVPSFAGGPAGPVTAVSELTRAFASELDRRADLTSEG